MMSELEPVLANAPWIIFGLVVGLVLICTWCLKLAAGWLDAENTGFFSCLAAIILSVIVGAISVAVIGEYWWVGWVATSLIYAFVLGASVLRALVIHLVSTGLSSAALFILFFGGSLLAGL